MQAKRPLDPGLIPDGQHTGKELLGGVDPRKAWARWPPSSQRAVISAAYTKIVVMPQGRIGDKFIPELIVLTYRE